MKISNKHIMSFDYVCYFIIKPSTDFVSFKSGTLSAINAYIALALIIILLGFIWIYGKNIQQHSKGIVPVDEYLVN